MLNPAVLWQITKEHSRHLSRDYDSPLKLNGMSPLKNNYATNCVKISTNDCVEYWHAMYYMVYTVHSESIQTPSLF